PLIRHPLLLFLCSGHHRDPHSFPTRRSSDLFPSLLVASDNDPAASPSRALQLARDWDSEAVVLAGAGHINPKSGFERWEQGFAQDRKSTRLNSSHVKISYAVFCLKKKKKNNT